MAQEFRQKLGRKAQEIREKSGKTQKDIAGAIGIYQNDLSVFETKGEKLGIAKIVALFDFLGYDIDVSEKKTSLNCA